MLCLTACISLMAQNISGKLVDEAQQPLPYANVVLQTVDSAFVTGTTTGERVNSNFRKSLPETIGWRFPASVINRCIFLSKALNVLLM
ncbi:MAG: carboxypeptidase-like regulatory domain-containing protein [Bacteroides cellulosilyticus]